MPDLSFHVESAEAEPFAAAPLVVLKLRVASEPATAAVRGILLRAQVRIDAPARRYADAEAAGLRDLFGEPARWGATLRSLVWTSASLSVPAFEGRVVVDLPLPCSLDLTVAAAKYFYALEGGEVPLTLLFSGTVFHAGAGGALEAAPVPWSREAAFRLPVAVWKEAVDRQFPGAAPFALRRDVFDRLYRLKVARGLATLDEALESLLPPEGARA